MPTLAINEAKNKLTVLRREALTGKEILMADTRRKDNKFVSLVATSLLDELCEETKTFTYKWVDIPGENQETYSLWNNETGVYGVGITKEEAIEDLIDNIIDYANVYFEDLPYYLSTSGNNRSHYWYLRRVIRSNGNREILYNALALEGFKG
jgi:hypothetical protein